MDRRLDDSNAPAPPGLVYVDDQGPGIRRRRRGKGFEYRGPDGHALRDAAQLRRIRALAIPPAYTEVWICPLPDGHLQATGRDARGRKQYRYHAAWREARDADKFGRMREFGEVLPRIRARVEADLEGETGRLPGRRAVLATVVRLLDKTLVRVGNDEYARENGSYGLTTLRRRHAQVKGSRLMLRFTGKSGIPHEIDIDDPKVARIVQRCQAMPGQELFGYAGDDGSRHTIGSGDVNDYLREVSGTDFISAKDFRTWHASVLALALLRELPSGSATATKSATVAVVKQVAQQLRNTAAVCRKSYVHPGLLECALGGDGEAIAKLQPSPKRGLSADERRLLAFLERR